MPAIALPIVRRIIRAARGDGPTVILALPVVVTAPPPLERYGTMTTSAPPPFVKRPPTP